MGLAIDTILASKANPGAGPTAAVVANGNSATVRSFNAPAYASLEQIIRAGATKGFAQVRSPLFHDDVRGIRVLTSEEVSTYLLPRAAAQPLTSQDTLTLELAGGTAETDLMALGVFYSDVAGTAARLHSWGDISGIVKSIKPLEVAVEASATIGQWVDTVITADEDLLHANTDYAVLGYMTDTQLAVIGVLGQETGNLRVCGPGVTDPVDTSDIFVQLSEYHGSPRIPVINAANKGSIYVSVADIAASTAANVSLVLAELSQNLPS